MPIGQPRRIFRSGMPRSTASIVVGLLVAGLIVAAGVSLAMRPRSERPPPPPVSVAALATLTGEAGQVAVIDGGTLKLRDRVVRLSGVAPPARGTSCDMPDAGGPDCGGAAANALAAMVRDRPVTCLVTGKDDLDRPLATCEAAGAELNSAVIAAGWARADRERPELQRAEQAAKAARRGIWASEANW